MSSLAALITAITPANAQQQAQLPKEERNWEQKNHDLWASNYSPQKQLTKDNVQLLELNWVYPVPDSAAARSLLTGVDFRAGSSEGGETPPLIVDGIAYVMTNYRQISAIDAENGKVIWVYRHTANISRDTKGLPVVPGASLHVHGFEYYDGKIWFFSWGCKVNSVDALSGKLVFELGPICKDIPGNKVDPIDKYPVGEGLYKNDCNTAEVGYYPPKKIVIVSCSGTEGGGGGRSFVAGYSADTKELFWRVFYAPPQTPPDPDWALKECSKGWFLGADFKQMASGSTQGWKEIGPFMREKPNIYTVKAWSCEEVRQKCPECLKDDWIAGSKFKTGSPWDGKHAGGSEISSTWGQYAVDVENDMVYFGTAQPAPDWNATFRPGPNLYADSIMGVNAVTGELKWWVQTWPHDTIDVDCNLNVVFGKIGNQRVVMKTCKNGISLGMDAATGKPLWIYDPFSLPDGLVKRPENFGCSAPTNPTNLAQLMCLNQWCDPVVGDYETLKKSCVNFGHHDRYMMESDMAFDGKTFYSSVMSGPNYIAAATNLVGNPPGGVQSGSGVRFPVNFDVMVKIPAFRTNSTITAIDALTGQVKWRWFRDYAHRGGVVVSNGVVYTNDGRGWITMLDADTGKEIARKELGFPLTSQITLGAGNDGKVKVFLIFGGGAHGVFGPAGLAGAAQIPGAVMAFGLPEKLPQPADVARKALKEIPKEQLKDVLKDIPPDVIQQAAPSTVSPITYGILGISVAILVVAAVLFTRRKKA